MKRSGCFSNCCLLMAVVFSGVSAETLATETPEFPLVHKVNPFIGTGAHGHTYPGAVLPFGMVQLSPDTFNQGWDWCSGYHDSDDSMMGFSHTHLSGTGSSDYGDFLFMPTTGALQFKPGSRKNPDEGYRSRFSHEQEHAVPGAYEVRLLDSSIDVSLTATMRVGVHRYLYPKTKEANVILDLTHFIDRSKILSSELTITSDREVRGFVRKSGWANDRQLYFVAQFSRPFTKSGIVVDEQLNEEAQQAKGTNLKGYVQFDTTEDQQVLVKVALSAVSYEGAARNLREECPDWDFAKTRQQAMARWEQQLNKIRVEGGTDAQQTTFYTALYHSCLVPHVFSDVDGQYRGMDKKVHIAKDFQNYTVFSLWDTFRALHPLMTIIEQERTNDFVNSLLTKYDQQGLLPKWELASNETWAMIGYHAVPVIVDAWKKNIRGFDLERAYQAMQTSASQDFAEAKSYRKHGYVAMDEAGRSASRTVEFAYDDWCIAQIAEELDRQQDAELYAQRSQFFRNAYDPTAGFLRGRDSDGSWKPDFHPDHMTGEFVEGNAWHYTWFAPHDIEGLIDLMGGKQAFTKKLDRLFTRQGREHVDVSGLIGQYAHGNEPSHNFAYLYAYSGQPWKTQRRVAQIVSELYSDQPDGICGNEDCGQMSAWYVFSAMGFYPVCPGQPLYVFGTPLFPRVTINLENGNSFEIVAENVSSQNIYIQSATLNGKSYDQGYLRHEDIIAGGELTFRMGSRPNKQWAQLPEHRPYSLVTKQEGARATAGTSGSPTQKRVVEKLTYQMRIPAAGDCTFKLSSELGTAGVFIRDKCVATGEITSGHLAAGVYPVRIECYYPMLPGQLKVLVRPAKTDKFKPLDQFVLTESEWLPAAELAQVPEESKFIDPALRKYVSLATGKPVACSGGTQYPNRPENAVDADISNASGWHSGSSPEWLQVDLQEIYLIDRIRLHTYYDNHRIYTYVIEVSTDGQNFSHIVDQRLNKMPSTARGFEHVFEPVDARYVRVRMLSNSANPGVHINELLVFGNREGVQAEPAVISQEAKENGSPIEITNIKQGETVRYPAPLLRGKLSDPSPKELTIRNLSLEAKSAAFRSDVHEGEFRSVVELIPGENQLVLQAGKAKRSLTLNYVPQKNPHKLRFFYVTDSTGETAYQTPLEDDSQNFRQKLDVAAKLMQSFAADSMHRNGHGRKTFNLELDDEGQLIVHVVKSPKPRAYFHENSAFQWYGHVSQLIQSQFPSDPEYLNIGIANVTEFDPAAGQVVGGVALGSPSLALFGSGAMYTWPNSLADTHRAFGDETKVDPRKEFDDSAGRSARWAIASTSIGAIVHEAGHGFGLPHTHDGQGIMKRGFDRFNRVFCVREPPSHRSREPRWFADTSQAAHWTPGYAAALDISRFFALDEASYANDRAPTLTLNEPRTKLTIESPNGIRWSGVFDFNRGNLYLDDKDYKVYEAPLPKQITFDVEEVRQQVGASKFSILVIDALGNRKDFHPREFQLPDN